MNYFIEMFRKSGALLDGHFCLTSGLHSPTYFQCALVLQFPEYCKLLAEKIVSQYRSKKIDVVITPAIGGIVVGQEVGRQLNVRTIFAERKDGRMRLRRGFNLNPGERVLVCEDVVTTGGSVQEVIGLVNEQEAKIVGIGVIVDRSNEPINFPVDQYAVVKLEAKTYSPEACPQCKQGIPIDIPGSRSA